MPFMLSVAGSGRLGPHAQRLSYACVARRQTAESKGSSEVIARGDTLTVAMVTVLMRSTPTKCDVRSPPLKNQADEN
ncbi:hypothetical protein PUN4_340159 [Paraburkholderia unamae]|nr:hypothetical protein PUN4_340159 [Paraburkholderia unamae]